MNMVKKLTNALLELKPINLSANIRCAVDDTGMNSVKPSTKAKIIEFAKVIFNS